jgi:glycosyltransferase involved in cell wall biosynthesis
MTILHVTKKYTGAIGGDAVVVSNLQKQQEADGHKVVIVTSNCDEIRGGKHVYKVGVRDTPSRLDTITPRRILSLLVLSVRMFAILDKERPDIIHAHSVDMAFFASFAARFFGIPLIHTFHIVTFYDNSQSLLRRKSELWLAKRARLSRATAPNAYDVRRLQAAGLKQAMLLPNGVDLTFWKAPLGRSKQPKTPTFLAVGRLERQKGYEYLIRASALLAKAWPQKFQVLIVGEGSEAPALRKLVRTLHIEHIVSLAGRKTPKQVRQLLASATVVVSPSLYETTPLTTLEAWAAAVPVISTPVGILRDAPADFDASYIVPPKDEQALMDTMYRCLTDKQARQTIALNGRKEAKRYAWPTIARTAEGIYRSAI